VDPLTPGDGYVTAQELARLVTQVRSAETARITETARTAEVARTHDRPDRLLKEMKDKWQTWGLRSFEGNRYLTREETAVVLDVLLDPFETLAIDYLGYFK
jgi:hypothetical protein